MNDPTFEQIIEAFKNDGALAEKVLIALNIGFWEEWDCDILRGMLVIGFGPIELQIAAKAVPNEIGWLDGGRKVVRDIDDIENRYTSHICVHVKNAGPIKDMEREEVQALLNDTIEHEIDLSKNDWVLEVEVV